MTAPVETVGIDSLVGAERVVTLGQVCSFKNGGTPTKAKQEYFEGNIPWITGADITSPIVNEARSRITQSAVDGSATNVVPRGSILLVTRTSVGKVATAGMELAFSQDITSLHPNTEILDSSYLVHFLKSRAEYFKQNARGATIMGITREVVTQLSLPLPSLEDQRRTAAVLEKVDELRDKRRQALSSLDDLVPAIFRRMFGDVRSPKQGIQLVPMGSLCNLVRGSSPRPQGDSRYFGGPIPRLMIADITRDGDLVTPRIDSLTVAGAAKSRPVPAGTVVMAVSGNIGLSAILSVDACIHDGFVGFTGLDASRVVPKYLQAVLKVGRELHESGVAGAIFKNITTTDIKKTNIPLPSLEAQLEFERFVSVIEATRTAHRKQLLELDALFESLQYRAFNSSVI